MKTAQKYQATGLRLIETRELASSPYRAPRIAVVIPAHNEEENIARVLAEISSLATKRPRWELLPIVVNDGSTDRTAAALREMAPRFGAAVVDLPINLGIGGAVQAGFKLASEWKADVVLQLDGDGQHPASEIPRIVCPVLAKKRDVIVGSRYVAGAGGNVSTGLRQLGTLVFSALLKVLVGVKIQDTTSGFRAFSAESADFIARYYPDDYPEVEAYVPLARRGFTIGEVAVNMRARSHGRSSITPIRSVYYMIKVSFATAMQVIRKLPARRKVWKSDEARR